MSYSQIRDSKNSAITLRQIIEFVWLGRAVIFGSVIIAILVSYVWILTSKPLYQATATYAPVEHTGSTDLLQNPALRSLASLTRSGGLVGADVPPFVKFRTLLTSAPVAEMLARSHPDVMHIIFESQWDSQSKRWRPPSGVSSAIIDTAKAVLQMPPWQPPSPDFLAAYLESHIFASVDDTTGLVTVSYSNSDREFAVNFLQWTCDAADSLLRLRARETTNRRIEYLQNLLPKVAVSEQRDALIYVLSQEEQSSLIIEADKNYSAIALMPPHTGLQPNWPRPLLMLAVGALIGGFFGICLQFLKRSFGLDVKLPRFLRLGRVQAYMRRFTVSS